MAIPSLVEIPEHFTESEKEKVKLLKAHFDEKTKTLKQSLSKLVKQYRDSEKKHTNECTNYENKIELRRKKLEKLDAVFEISRKNFEDSLNALRNDEEQTNLKIDEIKEFHRLEQMKKKKERLDAVEEELNTIRKKLEMERLGELKMCMFGTKERQLLVETVSSLEVRLRLQEEERLRWTSLGQEVSRRMRQDEEILRAQADKQEEKRLEEEDLERQKELTPMEEKLELLQAKFLKVQNNFDVLNQEHDISRSKFIKEQESAQDLLQNCNDLHNTNVDTFKKSIKELQATIASLSTRMDDELYYLIEEIMSKRKWAVELGREMSLLSVGQRVGRPWKNSPHVMWPVELIERPYGGGRARQKEFKFGKKPKPLPDISVVEK